MTETKEDYKKLGFDLFATIKKKRKERQLSKREARCEALCEIKKCLASESKYFSYLSGLTVKELRDIARESRLYGYTALRKASLIRFLDKRRQLIKKCVEKRMFPDAMRAWVELFASKEFAAEHFTQVIMSTLSDMSCFKKKKKSVAPRRMRRGRRRRNKILTDSDSEEEDIGDNWRRL